MRSSMPSIPSCISPPKPTSTAPSSAPSLSSAPTSWAPSPCWRQPARLDRQSAASRLDRCASTMSPPMRSSARWNPDDPAFTETTPYAPNSPYAAIQGCQRPPGARLLAHLRPARHHHQLLQQLRPVPVPRKADPADDPERHARASPCRSTATGSRSATGCMWKITARPSGQSCAQGRRARPITSAAATSRPT